MAYLDKSLSDPSWHNDLSIVLLYSVMALICLRACWKFLGDDDNYIPAPTKKQRKIWEEEDKKKK